MRLSAITKLINIQIRRRLIMNIDDLTNCLKQADKAIPKLTQTLRKGDCGKIAVIGGSTEYTGAPFYAGITALKLGADLVHIFCAPEAAPVIKSYSPELIVHPLAAGNEIDTLQKWLPNMSAFVLGPGLGRDSKILPDIVDIVCKISGNEKIPLTIDADGLWFVKDNINMVKNNDLCTLTPNAVEFWRLAEKLNIDCNKNVDSDLTQMLAKQLNVTVLTKYRDDFISNSKGNAVTVSNPYSVKRSGGQGDLLSGACAIFTFWAKQNGLSNEIATLTGAVASSTLIRTCSKITYDEIGRSMSAFDMTHRIPQAAVKIFKNY